MNAANALALDEHERSVTRIHNVGGVELTSMWAKTQWGAPDESILSVAERVRGADFPLERDRRERMLAAWLLRELVFRLTGHPSREIRIDRRCPHCGAQHGRPRVEGIPLNLSVSHSGGHVVVIATETPAEVGIDIEAVGPEIHLADRLSTSGTALPGVLDLQDWVRKEAVLKALGVGLAIEPEYVRFEDRGNRRVVSSCPGVNTELTHIEVEDLTEQPDEWAIVGSIAVAQEQRGAGQP
jgi:4'-phosphopantetheinyl transferase